MRFGVCAVFLVTVAAIVAAGSLDIQKLKLKGEQQVKDLRYFQSVGLAAARNTSIEMTTEAFEKSLVSWKESKPQDRNAALKLVQAQYEKFSLEFKAIADIHRDWVEKYQSAVNEKSGEAYADTATREKALGAIEVAKQNENRAASVYQNRNYSYSAHLYLKSIRYYAKVFELRGWKQLAAITPEKSKKKSK